MASKLTLRYDAIGDILYVEKRPPHAGQGSRQIEDEIVVRFDPESREVESLEVLFFSKRLQEGETLELPIEGELGVAV
jgi:uncharacterized protein YuzE